MMDRLADISAFERLGTVENGAVSSVSVFNLRDPRDYAAWLTKYAREVDRTTAPNEKYKALCRRLSCYARYEAKDLIREHPNCRTFEELAKESNLLERSLKYSEVFYNADELDGILKRWDDDTPPTVYVSPSFKLGDFFYNYVRKHVNNEL